jgi:hypothetical protein
MPCWSKSSAVQVKELAALKAVRTMSLFDTERVILSNSRVLESGTYL